jgi:hypothetical protein
VTFADGLMLLFELADREDERFQRAAARWHARFTLAAELPLRESEMTMNLLCAIRGATGTSSVAACSRAWSSAPVATIRLTCSSGSRAPADERARLATMLECVFADLMGLDRS